MDELILIVDLEATCWPPGSPERARQALDAEIIELGALLTSPLLREVDQPPAQFERLIKPQKHPELTPFCVELTGLTTAQLSNARSLKQALEELWSWIEGESGQPRARWRLSLASWGPFDRGILRRQCAELGLWLPDWSHIDLKRSFERWCRRHRREGARFGLRRALTALELTHEGPAHRALSDAVAAWRLWCHIHSPSQLSALASALLTLILTSHGGASSLTPVLWSRALPAPLNHKASFERAAQELLDANLAQALEYGRGYVLSERAQALLICGELNRLTPASPASLPLTIKTHPTHTAGGR